MTAVARIRAGANDNWPDSRKVRGLMAHVAELLFWRRYVQRLEALTAEQWFSDQW